MFNDPVFWYVALCMWVPQCMLTSDLTFILIYSNKVIEHVTCDAIFVAVRRQPSWKLS